MLSSEIQVNLWKNTLYNTDREGTKSLVQYDKGK